MNQIAKLKNIYPNIEVDIDSDFLYEVVFTYKIPNQIVDYSLIVESLISPYAFQHGIYIIKLVNLTARSVVCSNIYKSLPRFRFCNIESFYIKSLDNKEVKLYLYNSNINKLYNNNNHLKVESLHDGIKKYSDDSSYFYRYGVKTKDVAMELDNHIFHCKNFNKNSKKYMGIISI